MQFKSILTLFNMIVAVVAAPAADSGHESHDIHKHDHGRGRFGDDEGRFHDDEGFHGDHSVNNDVDFEDHSNSCGHDQTAMCCDSLNKKDVNGLELLLGQGCLLNAVGCTNKAACCKQQGGGLTLIQVCQLL